MGPKSFLLAAAAHAALAAGLGLASSTPEPYSLAMGPDLPGLGSYACKIAMKPLGPAAADGGVVTFGSWLGELKHALIAQDSAPYLAGIERLCGARSSAESSHHTALPAPNSAGYAAVLNGVDAMAQACADGSSASYAASYNTICPDRGAIGPTMPERCETTVPDPTVSTESGPKRLRLQLFIGKLKALMEAEEPDDEAWRRAMQTVCGDMLGVGGAGFHSHRPLAGTPTYSAVRTAVALLGEACGKAERDAKAYGMAWKALCPSTPTEDVPVLSEPEVKELTRQERVVAAIEAVASSRSKVRGLVDAVKAAMAMEARYPHGNSKSAEFKGLAKALAELAELEAQWDSTDAARTEPAEKACAVEDGDEEEAAA